MAKTRRNFLIGGAALMAAGAARPLLHQGGNVQVARALAAAQPSLPKPAASGIDHVVVVCMENRSFDHILGWLPGADGKQAGLSYPDKNGVRHPTYT